MILFKYKFKQKINSLIKGILMMIIIINCKFCQIEEEKFLLIKYIAIIIIIRLIILIMKIKNNKIF